MNLHESLKKYYGFDSFRKGQQEVISRVVSGQSSAAIFPTGSGKSLCYQLPAMLLPHLTMVVSPLLALMKDQLDFLLAHNIPAARLDSSLSGAEYNDILSRAVQGDINILMISVERFRNERFRNRLSQMRISLMVVDEAHCISEWGHNFRPEYLRLPEYRKEFGIKNVLLLTATATKRVADDMGEKFDITPENIISTGFYRENLTLHVVPVSDNEKRLRLLSDIKASDSSASIVYVTQQKTAETVASYLIDNNIKASAYHAGLKNEERTAIQDAFMQGLISCVVATIAFGMGIDKNNIRTIIHYDLPKSIENYSQEIGRAGRDNQKANCIVYGNTGNISVLENFIYGDTPDKTSIIKLLKEIKSAGSVWEIKMSALSRDVNIRVLPLKTLMVYLGMKQIIQPRHTYFEEYVFKFNKSPEEISAQFQGERQLFVKNIFNHCNSKKVWTTVDMDSLCHEGPSARKRVLAALDYFAEKQLIELTAKQAVDVFEVLNSSFDTEYLGSELYSLFKEKETSEIKRIHDMTAFFESDSCLSKGLTTYFGESVDWNECGHCSFCLSGAVQFPVKQNNSDLSEQNRAELLASARAILGVHSNADNMTRFFCGISTPLFFSLKAKKSKAFGALEDYPYQDVKNWVRGKPL